jgi:hypothetical protein
VTSITLAGGIAHDFNHILFPTHQSAAALFKLAEQLQAMGARFRI